MTIVDEGIALPGLTVPGTSYVADPGLGDIVEKEYERVTIANPTHDPNRMTMHVPSEHTVLSLGAASPRWNTDIGIVGYSDKHIHFETKTNDKTIVSLGESATTSAINGHGDEPPTETKGYAMITAQYAWHQAEGQFYILSRDKDISVRTMGANKRAVVQADEGYVDLNGGKEVTLSGTAVAIGAKSGLTMEDIHYDKPWHGNTPTFTFTSNASTGVDILNALVAVHDLALTAFKTIKAAVTGKLERNEYFWADNVSWLSDLAAFVVSFGKLKDTFTNASSPPGCVKLAAEKDVVGVAGHDVAMFGTRAAGLGAAVSTSVGAGLMATMKAALFAGVGGALTTFKAVKKVEVLSPTGDVVIGGKTNVCITSDHHFMAGGEEVAQVSADDAVLLGGAKSAWIGTGAGDTWGMKFSEKEIAFGKAKDAQTMEKADVEPSPAIRIDTGKIEIHGTDGCVTLQDDLCLIEAPKILLTAKKANVTFNGSRALTFK